MQKVVDQIKTFWLNRLMQVLPDRPDLIVLPEYCAIPRGMSREVRKRIPQGAAESDR
jgi:hypothetical protein